MTDSIHHQQSPAMRRLPVYLILDHSVALKGTRIVSLNSGVQSLRQRLGPSINSANVYISIITFADTISRSVLAPLDQFVPVRLNVAVGCKLGAALSALQTTLEFDLIRDQPGRPGDHRPLVVVMLGDIPTDDWLDHGSWLLRQALSRHANVLGVALDTAAVNVLHKVASIVLSIQTRGASEVTSFFSWLCTAIEEMVRSAGLGETTTQLPALPRGIIQC